jgi:hypothetical protein
VDVQLADFNGDGKRDLAGRVLQDGTWWVALSTGGAFANSTKWATWAPDSAGLHWVDVKVGDFNGDGKADIAGRYLETGQWWVNLSAGSSFNTSLWVTWNPAATWVDIQVGDFNGDGRSDLAGRYKEAGQWWVAASSGSAFNNTLWTTWAAAVTWVDVRAGKFA